MCVSMLDSHRGQASCCHGGFFFLRRSVLGDFCSNGCLQQSRLRLRLFWIFCKEFSCFWTVTLGLRSGPDQPLRHVRHVPRGPRSQGARGIMPSGKNSIIAYFTREHLQQTLFYLILTVCRWLTFSPYH